MNKYFRNYFIRAFGYKMINFIMIQRFLKAQTHNFII